MVKLVCNRCGKECKETYHTISVSTHDTKPTFIASYCAAEVAVTKATYSPIAELNRTPHYCSDCMDAINSFLKGETL